MALKRLGTPKLSFKLGNDGLQTVLTSELED